jgi:hypothetical protein
VGTPRFECFDVRSVREVEGSTVGADSADQLDIYGDDRVLAPVVEQIDLWNGLLQ